MCCLAHCNRTGFRGPRSALPFLPRFSRVSHLAVDRSTNRADTARLLDCLRYHLTFVIIAFICQTIHHVDTLLAGLLPLGQTNKIEPAQVAKMCYSLGRVQFRYEYYQETEIYIYRKNGKYVRTERRVMVVQHVHGADGQETPMS